MLLAVRGLIFMDEDRGDMPLGPRQWLAIAIGQLRLAGWQVVESLPYENGEISTLMKLGDYQYVTVYYREHDDGRVFAGTEAG